MLETVLFSLLILTVAAHVGTTIVTMFRFRRLAPVPPVPPDSPKVSIIRPVAGLENHLEACIESTFRLSYPNCELIFCADEPNDAAIPIVRSCIEKYPNIDARIVTGRDDISANPKLNNVVKGWRAATADYVIMSDSNTLLPTDYVEQLLAKWDDKTGVVSSVFELGMADGFASDVECAFINSLQARWVWAADTFGNGFAMGKTLMYRKSILERLGGLPRLAEAAAEDIATTLTMREAGLDIHHAQRVVQPIGRRSLAEVIQRQVRWARLRRVGFRGIYAAEILNGGWVPFACAAALAGTGALPAAAAAGIVLGWYAFELALIRMARWPLSWRTLPALVARDVLIPYIWLAGLFGSRFDWRGNQMTVADTSADADDQTVEAEAR